MCSLACASSPAFAENHDKYRNSWYSARLIVLSIVIPVYNEAGSLRDALARIRTSCTAANLSYELIVVNDASTDATAEILAQEQGITVLHHAENLGYGASLKTGIRASRGEVIGMTDPDGTYPVEDFPRFMQELTPGVEMVIGVRTGRSEAFPLLRRPGKVIVNSLAAFLVGKYIPDLNSGMRVFRRPLFDRFQHLLPDGFSFTTTITLGALTNRLGVRWLPIPYAPRVGKSTMTFGRGLFREFPAFLTLVVRITTYFKPLRFFAVPSAVFLLAGIANLARTLILERNISDASILLIVVGIQIGLMGLVADLVVKSRGT